MATVQLRGRTNDLVSAIFPHKGEKQQRKIFTEFLKFLNENGVEIEKLSGEFLTKHSNILTDTREGRHIFQTQEEKISDPSSSSEEVDKILNPQTGRFVKKSGKIGKAILANQKP